MSKEEANPLDLAPRRSGGLDSECHGAAPCPFDEHSRRAARSNCTLLITGETGVGKGFLAKWLHSASRRHEGPFIPVNCGAIPETIIDSQLFGHAHGAFSGATSAHLGLVRAAEKGTLFLDEVGELPPSAQTRLLRLLQDREVQPVGHARPIIVDVRIIAATNGDLHAAVRARTFREDLLFRLDVIRLHVRPLRERFDELMGLVDAFNHEFAELYQQAPLDFDESARRHLMGHRWPGNIRELRTVVERLHVLCPDEPVSGARLADVGHRNDMADGPGGPGRFPEQIRYEELIRVLETNGGSVTQAAAVFGVHRSTIYRWLQGRERAANRPS